MTTKQQAEEITFTLQELTQLFLDWCNLPETFFQRKSMVVKSNMAGVPDKQILGAGIISFVTDFPTFCQNYANEAHKVEVDKTEKKSLSEDKIDLDIEKEKGNEEKPEGENKT